MSFHTPTPPSPAAANYERMRRAGSTAYAASLDLQKAQEALTKVLHDLQSLADPSTAEQQSRRLEAAWAAAGNATSLLAQACEEMRAAAEVAP